LRSLERARRPTGFPDSGSSGLTAISAASSGGIPGLFARARTLCPCRCRGWRLRSLGPLGARWSYRSACSASARRRCWASPAGRGGPCGGDLSGGWPSSGPPAASAMPASGWFRGATVCINHGVQHEPPGNAPRDRGSRRSGLQQADVSDRQAAGLSRRRFGRRGRLTFWPTTAIIRDGLLVEMSDEDWRSVLGTNLDAVNPPGGPPGPCWAAWDGSSMQHRHGPRGRAVRPTTSPKEASTPHAGARHRAGRAA
jgi:hypothetical protein